MSSAKRQATKELNYDNWDEEDEPEEAGVFKTAPEEELKKRVIKKARRTIKEADNSSSSGNTKSVFSSFSGFGNVAPAENKAQTAFSFLSKISENPAPSTEKSNFVFNSAESNKSNEFPKMKTTNLAEDVNKNSKSAEFCKQLVSLNNGFCEWIKTCVDKNPLCFLTPIFKNYENYIIQLENEEKERNQKSESSETKEASATTTSATASVGLPIPIFSFANNPSTSVFGNQATSSFANKSNGFSFGTTTKTEEEANPVAGTSGFSFKPVTSTFSFGNMPASTSSETTAKEAEDEEDEPPKAEFKQVVEEGSVYTKKCKVFVKKNDEFADRGVGSLYLKPVQDGDKTQLLVRADTNLGNILVNLILSAGIPVQRTGKNNVMLVCVPTPEEKKAAPLLLRVKTAEEADELFDKIKSLQK